jgi:hypothetical protein
MAKAMKTATAHEVRVAAGPVALPGDLVIPAASQGLALFAHGSGSSRLSSRNRAVAAVLNEGGLSTLLLDLLTPDEESVDVRRRHAWRRARTGCVRRAGRRSRWRGCGRCPPRVGACRARRGSRSKGAADRPAAPHLGRWLHRVRRGDRLAAPSPEAGLHWPRRGDLFARVPRSFSMASRQPSGQAGSKKESRQ